MNRRAFSWAMYDWANSAYATVVIAGFFPVFFKQYWAQGLAATESTLRLGLANSISSALIACAAPLLGAIADRVGARKRLLLYFAVGGIVTTAALHLVAAGAWVTAAALYILATLGFTGANLFYDAMLVEVASERQLDRISAWGYALGYLGGGLLLALLVLMIRQPQAFGFAGATEVVRSSFPMVAVWWALFSIPLLVFVPESGARERLPLAAALGAALRELYRTLQHLRQFRVILLFLVAYWLYIDAVGTIIRMAVDYGLALGFKANDLITALLITQFVGFPAAVVFGYFAERFGTKIGIYVAIAAYAGITGWAAVIDTVGEFYLLATLVGLVQGGIQSLSRAFYARLIPRERAAEFFGFYNLLGKFAAIIGPTAIGWAAVWTGSSRLSVLVLLVLLLLGAFVLHFVDVERGRSLRSTL